MPSSSGRFGWRAAGLAAALFVIYNANGRETPSYDTQPTKLAAHELAVEGTLTLDRVVANAPDLGTRAGFQKDRGGHYRSGYSIVPILEAAVLTKVLDAIGLVRADAPLGPAFIAVLTASLLTACAIALVYVAIARAHGPTVALLVAIAMGLGTNLWSIGSRTLWQAESVCAGLAIALFALWRPSPQLRAGWVLLGGVGLALAGAARPATAPLVAVVLLGLTARVGWRRALPAALLVAAAGATVASLNWTWFGHVIGAPPPLQADNFSSHRVEGTWTTSPWTGALGLLVSPNRGLLVFSPVVIVALAALPFMWRRRSTMGESWWAVAAIAQFATYSCYTVWWGGHTYGPRYMLDLLVALVPAAAVGTEWVLRQSWRRVMAAVLLAASIVVAATGAWCYPNDQWNSDPAEVDVTHARLWDWRDLQIVRCWRAGPDPRTFSLFTSASVRAPRPN